MILRISVQENEGDLDEVLAEWKEIEAEQAKCKSDHTLEKIAEDGCPDCGFYSK